MMGFLVPAMLVFSTHYAEAEGDGYGSGGIAKYTLSASEPVAFFAFLQRYFPVHCQDQGTPCNVSFDCGQAGRASLCVDDSCTQTFGNHVFGLHLVNLSARPYGLMDNVDVERHFTDKLSKAFRSNTYDAFMDISAVLYAADLDKYGTALRRDHVPFLVLEWDDDMGHTWYSLIVQVSTSQLILELVSNTKPSSAPLIVKDNLQRLPSFVFALNNVSTASAAVLVPLGISKGVSNMEAVSQFYTEEMFAVEKHSATSGSTILRALSLSHSTLLVRLVERSPIATSGKFKISDLEAAKLQAHQMSSTDEFCGVDKWYDNHFAYDAFWNTSLDEFKAAFDKRGRIYHIFGDCKPSTRPGPGTNIYVVDPTGDAVQVDGKWKHCPEGGSGDALQNPCAQGNCYKYQASQRCSAKLDNLCAEVKLGNSTCTDCCYLRWHLLEDAGCRNADVVNYCIPHGDARLDVVV